MSVEAELLAAIAAAPDDDEPRLVYADHLLGRGELRGELITLQCQLARTDAADQPFEPAIVARERSLLAKHAEAWTMGACAVLDGGYQLRRGLIEHVDVWGMNDIVLRPPAPDVAVDDHAPDRLAELFEHAPLLRSIMVRSEALLYPLPPSWTELRALHLTGTGHADAIAGALQPLTALRRLHLTCAALVGHQLAAVLELAQPLEHLGIHVGWHVGSRPTGEHATTWIAANPRLHGLRSLHLAGFALPQLDRLACLQQLERLSLDRCRVGPSELIALVGQLPALTMLEYQFHDSDSAQCDVAALLRAAPRLRRLALSGIVVDPAGLAALAGSPLRRLILERAEVGDRGAQALLDADDLAPIELAITDDELTFQTADRLAARALSYRPAPPQLPPSIAPYLDGNKIMAVKAYRELTGCGLADAKMAVEQLSEEQTGRPAYQRIRAQSRWCRP